MAANFLTQEDVQALKDYVRGPSTANRAENTVLLAVTHSNLEARFMEVRFDMHMTVQRVKEKLVSHTGTNISAMRLQLKDHGGRTVAEMSEDWRPLGYYSPEDGFAVHVVDLDPTSASAGGWLEDTSKVDKYQMSDEAYNAREKTFRKFKEEKLKEDPTWCIEKEMAERRGETWVPPAPKESDPEAFAAEAGACEVGKRCQVEPGKRRGTVRFVGKDVPGLPLGWWVGVQYDEPVGKNDGSVKGHRLFECPDRYGAVVRPNNIECGDFPEEDIDWDDDEI